MVKRIIDTQFWEDSTVVDKYTPEDKYFMLYLLTNPKTTAIGIYSMPIKICAFDLGYSVDTITFLLDRFEKVYQNIRYNTKEQEIVVLNSLKYTISKGGKPVEDMVQRELKAVKTTEYLAVIHNHLEEWWNISNRDIDMKIKDLIVEELTKRNSIHLINANANANANANTDSYHESYDESSKPIPYKEIVAYLNEKTGRQFKHTTNNTKKLIKARWNEGFRVEDFKKAIDNKVIDWASDKKMVNYLRPETLFGTKFEGYVNETPAKPKFQESVPEWLNDQQEETTNMTQEELAKSEAEIRQRLQNVFKGAT